MRQWKLRYDSPATRRTEALPLRNGSLGAMVYGGCFQERIALNLDTLWSGCGREKENPGKDDWEKIRRLLFMHRHKEALLRPSPLSD
ncbi:MAG: glycoside hydrolase N-terminal domain-containing protein [Lachnospiraceae bacterium]